MTVTIFLSIDYKNKKEMAGNCRKLIVSYSCRRIAMHRKEFQELVNKVYFNLFDTGTLDEIFHVIAGPLLTLPEIHTVFIHNLDKNYEITHIAGLLPVDSFNAENSRGIIQWILQEGQPLIIPDSRVDPRINPSLDDQRIKGGGCWPIRVNGRINHILCLISGQVREFTAEESAFINVIAKAGGHWLSYLSLQEEAKLNRRKLVALEEISRVLNSSLEMKTVLNMIIDLSVNLFNVDFSCVYLLDKDSGQLDLKVARGIDEGLLKNLECRFSEKRDFANLADFAIKAEDELLGYLTLGWGNDGFPVEDRDLVTTFANLAGVAIRNSLLFTDRQRAYRQTVNALSMAIEARDKYMRGHTAKVREYAVALGHKLGLAPLALKDLEDASILHDIGKLGVSETTLNKYGEFTRSEYEEFKRHTVLGAEIVEAMEDFSHLAPAIRHHHENYDGTGYPDGLAGEEIPLKARIITIADAFAALTSARHNSTARNGFDALKLIKEDAGTRFDPELVEIFEKVVREKHWVRIERFSVEEKDTGRSGETPDLTEREMEILGLIAAGLNNKEISDTLYLSEKTVKTHVSNILHKLNLTDRTKAAVYAIKNGLVTWVEL